MEHTSNQDSTMHRTPKHDVLIEFPVLLRKTRPSEAWILGCAVAILVNGLTDRLQKAFMILGWQKIELL